MNGHSSWLVVMLVVAMMSRWGTTNASEVGDEARALLKAYRAVPDDLEKRFEVVESLLALDGDYGAKFFGHLGQVWEHDRAAYLNAFEKRCVMIRKECRGNADRLKRLRTRIVALREQREVGLTKSALREVAWPAMQEMRALVWWTPERVLKEDEQLIQARRRLHAVAMEWIHCRKALLDLSGLVDWELVEREEEVQATLASLCDAKARALYVSNRKLGVGLDPKEMDCVHDLNFMRMLLGLRGLELDVDLCASARDHCAAMKRLRFFGHESPVTGMRTPSDRAHAHGTSARAENIAQGQEMGAGANRALFLSPGHHLNLFGDFKRVGVGRHERLWTQVFW